MMLQEALILALFTLRYIQHCYSSLEIQNAFKETNHKTLIFHLTVLSKFSNSKWVTSQQYCARVNIQRLKLSRNPSSCGVCCIAFRRTSSSGEEAAPLTCRGGCPGPWAAAPFPPPGTFWQSSDNCPHFCNPGGELHSPFASLYSPAGTISTQNPARTAPGVPLRSLTLPAEEGHGKILKQKVLIWNPNYLAVSPANSRFIEDCVAATIQWHLDLLFFCFLLHLDPF